MRKGLRLDDMQRGCMFRFKHIFTPNLKNNNDSDHLNPAQNNCDK